MVILRLATYNVHSCVGVDRRLDPARVADVVAELDSDVIALQEFVCPGDVALQADPPAALASFERYSFALGPTRLLGDHHFGNVLLSRHPVRDVSRVDLSCERREPRGALTATIDHADGALHVVATHLGLRLGERRRQVRRLLDHIDSRSTPAMAVLGDFNDWLPGRSVAHMLDRRLGKAQRRRTYPSWLPVLPLDRIWVHPRAAVRDVHVHRSALARVASDHLPVVATVEWS